MGVSFLPNNSVTDAHGYSWQNSGWDLVWNVSRSVQQGESLSECLNSICAKLHQEMRYDGTAVLLSDEEERALLIHGAAGLSPRYVEKVNGLRTIVLDSGEYAEGPSTRAYHAGQPAIIHNVFEDQSFRPWQDCAFEEGYVSVASFPLIARRKTIGVLNCYSALPRSFSDHDVHILSVVAAFAAIAIDVTELHASLTMQYGLMQRANAVHDALTTHVLGNDGIQAIADTFGEFVDSPIAIFDENLSVRACTTFERAAFSKNFSTLVDHAAFIERVEYLRRNYDPITLPLCEIDKEFEEEDESLVVAPIVAHNDLLGYVAMATRNGHVRQVNVRELEQAATVLALEFIKEKRAHEVELRITGHLLEDLLNAREADYVSIERRARQMGFDLEGVHQVLQVRLERGNGKGGRAHAALTSRALITLKATIEGLGYTAIGAERREKLVIIWRLGEVGEHPAPDCRKIVERLLRVVQNLDGDANVRIGYGSPASTVQGIQRSYKEAEQTLQVLSRFRQPSGILSIEEIGIFKPLLDSENPQQLIDFAERLLGEVAAHDRRRNLNLIDTLDVYLQCDGSTEQTAARLHFHPNTVRYRLQRISQLTEKRLTSLEDLLEIKLAMTIWRLVRADTLPNS